MTFFKFEDVRQGQDDLIVVFTAVNNDGKFAYGDELNPQMLAAEMTALDAAALTAFAHQKPVIAEQRAEYAKAQQAVRSKLVARM